ncbi:hypothetical protein QJS04_geneDACA007109 [Acorus gramineus]|uniref:RING-CH-type domain-containing protein n=1 Tax=Acorus gramineus TaxID=55184 RepID=A0AAV9BLQ0_ACOGR|nr:hypothetical protein QJS04_geneDACA007109 [Acorus gramineus]
MRGEEETLLVEEGQVLSYSIRLCRICHEEEIEFGGGEGKEENSTSMESPCACSGSLKFAHRDCIQRWCDEKGNTICEICLQNFEPGYTIPKKFQLGDVAVTIRDSLAVPRENYEPQRPDSTPATAEHELDRRPECTIASDGTASCCRSMAFTFTLLLLARHLISVLAISADQYALTLVTETREDAEEEQPEHIIQIHIHS